MYVALWGYVSFILIVSLKLSVFDSGIFQEFGWNVLHYHWTLDYFFVYLFTRGGVFYLFPLTITGSYWVLLVLEVVFVGAAAFPLFGIAKCYFPRGHIPLLISTTYLVYFPLAGQTWFPSHLQSFLPLFFFTGFYLYLKGHLEMSLVVLVLGGLLRFPLAVFTLLFAVSALVSLALYEAQISQSTEGGVVSPYVFELFAGRRLRDRVQSKGLVSNLRLHCSQRISLKLSLREYSIALLSVSGMLLLLGAVELPKTGAVGGFGQTFSYVTQTGAPTPFSTLPIAFFTLFIFCAPLFFLVLLSPRWLVFTLPYAYLTIFSSTQYFHYPKVVQTQYPALIVPFLFLGTIEGLWRLSLRHYWASKVTFKARRLVRSMWRLILSLLRGRVSSTAGAGRDQALIRSTFVGYHRHVKERGQPVAIAIATTSLLLVTVFQPYGPFNADSTDNFYMGEVLSSYNLTMFNEYVHLASMVPGGDPYVVYQNNLPEVLPRPLPYENAELIPGEGFEMIAYNYSHQMPNGAWVPIRIDYAIANPYSIPYDYFAEGQYPYNVSMYDVVRDLYGNRSYGIEGEASGMVLLEKGYSGPLNYFVPFSSDILPSAFHAGNLPYSHYSSSVSRIVINNQTHGGTAWWGPFVSLSPGNYAVTFELSTTNNSTTNHLGLDVVAGSNLALLGSEELTGANFTGGRETNVTLQVYVNNFVSGVQFRGIDTYWNGTLEMHGVRVTEVAPPSTQFVVGTSSQDRAVYSLLNLTAGSRGELLLSSSMADYLTHTQLTPLFTASYAPSSRPEFALYDSAEASNCGPPSNLTGSTLCQIVSYLYEYGGYGVLGEARGIALLERGYVGVPELFEPDQAGYASSMFHVGNLTTGYYDSRAGAIVVKNQTHGGTAWWGPFVSLSPGNYAVTFELSTTNNSTTNHLGLDVVAGSNLTLLGSEELTGANFTGGRETNVTLQVYVNNFVSGVQFRGIDTYWNGTLEMYEVNLLEDHYVTMSNPWASDSKSSHPAAQSSRLNGVILGRFIFLTMSPRALVLSWTKVCFYVILEARPFSKLQQY